MSMNLPQALDTDLLRAFVLIAEGHSFTQAAARVGRTQSAVSMQVKRLEEVLGQPVLSRSKGGSVELTPHGQYLLTRARQILALNDEVLTTFRDAADRRNGAAGHAGRLRVRLSAADPEALRRNASGGPGGRAVLAVGRTDATAEGRARST